jgi:hypothetical protein
LQDYCKMNDQNLLRDGIFMIDDKMNDQDSLQNYCKTDDKICDLIYCEIEIFMIDDTTSLVEIAMTE